MTCFAPCARKVRDPRSQAQVPHAAAWRSADRCCWPVVWLLVVWRRKRRPLPPKLRRPRRQPLICGRLTSRLRRRIAE